MHYLLHKVMMLEFMYTHTLNYHAVAPIHWLTVGDPFDDHEGSSHLWWDSTCSCQCIGTGAAVCTALGITPSSRWISTGRPVMHSSGRCGQVLKVDDAKWCSSHSSILTGVHSNGSATGRTGTTVRGGQDHKSRESAVCVKPPAFTLPCLSVDLVGGCCANGWSAAAPTDGKLWDTIPRSIIASHEDVVVLIGQDVSGTKHILTMISTTAAMSAASATRGDCRLSPLEAFSDDTCVNTACTRLWGWGVLALTRGNAPLRLTRRPL